MLQFDAAPVVTSNPFSVNGKHFLSCNREMFGDRRDRSRVLLADVLIRREEAAPVGGLSFIFKQADHVAYWHETDLPPQSLHVRYERT
jgi:hypothetical protein